jgi:hypothetical protein
MSLDLADLSNEFDDWLIDIDGQLPKDDLSEERLVQLVGTTLREVQPKVRAAGLVDLANLCYAMADKALGSQASGTKCFEVVVRVGQRQ